MVLTGWMLLTSGVWGEGAILRAQDMMPVCFYVTGSSGGNSPYVEFMVDDNRIKSIGSGEYHCALVRGDSRRVIAKRAGFKDKVLASSGREPQFFRADLRSYMWSFTRDDAAPPQLKQVANALLDRESESTAGIKISGLPPLGQTLRMEWGGPEGCAGPSQLETKSVLLDVIHAHFTVVERSGVDAVLNEQRIALSGVASADTPVQAGELTTASCVAMAQLQCDGKGDLRFVDSTSGEVVCWIGLMGSPADMRAELTRLFSDRSTDR